MYPVLLRLGPITIYSYGVMVALAFIVGIIVALKQAKKEGINSEIVLDLVFWGLISSLVGARLLYVLINFSDYRENPLEIIMLQKGGLVFYGGLILAAMVGIGFLKKRGLEVWKIADLIAPSIVLGHSLGRIGCFLNGCCYGKEAPPPWGIKFLSQSSAGNGGHTLIPIQLYSSLGLLILFFILRKRQEHKRFEGEIFWLYLFLYSVLRFILEIFRGDPRGHILFFSTSQFIGIIVALVSLLILLKLKYKSV
jgi:phosphatidylglycerol:prolipoprotein diacylglycerol transferase